MGDISGGLTAFFTIMVGLSVASERVTETLKQALCGLTGKFTPSGQAAFSQTLAILSGIAVVGISHVDPLHIVNNWGYWGQGHVPHFGRWVSILSTGLLASGGSAFWNHLLDILKATKVNMEQTADNKLAAAGKPPIAG